ncbi:hypothetical protein H4CHR_05436 [Variovorax sp. PBS-H4]|uniref:DUF5985 family protein n=1 Tax=Variovorax sp. PBS-H4 TaxID=434008 RepID=UPI001317D2E3|nr:DUF5985 family protein [Variovorax sp. PBS-H4]VTU40708.1 hypothetical protein H4CHR_05436 [Variovorax sp. PBS-H4]
MDKIIYGLCALTALSCAGLLLRGYATSRARLLLWSGLCFVGLTANNVLLILDRLLFPAIDMSIWRLSTALMAVLLLLVGLVLESQS